MKIATGDDKYLDVVVDLEGLQASPESTFLQPNGTCPSLRTAGLLNLGNTCYMSSVMQALLLTRQFSTHVMLQMNSVPYWAKMGVLFAKMLHSVTNQLDPVDFFEAVKPPHYIGNEQQDSSEFLGYLLDRLKSFEHCSDVNFDYSNPADPNTSHFSSYSCRSVPSQPTSTSSEVETSDEASNRRSVSPRPGSSGSESSGTLNKRTASESVALKKRICITEPFLGRDSFVDSMLGGVLLTRLECTECHSSSLSRDVFRDLQLAFPENTESWQFSVQNLLEYYFSEEILTGVNKYKCCECGVLQDAVRSVLVETTPKYLIIVLKNFKYDAELQELTKLMQKVHCNYTITLPTVRSQTVHSNYVLYACVVHAGTTLHSGHYYTLGKDADAWHSYNDEEVTDTNEAEINHLSRCRTPYILFYRRTDIEEGTALSFEHLPLKLQEQVISHNKEIVDNARSPHRIEQPQQLSSNQLIYSEVLDYVHGGGDLTIIIEE